MITSSNTLQLWENLGDQLTACSQAARSTVAINHDQDLHLAFMVKLQQCIRQWEEIERRIQPKMPTEDRWSFDQLGNLLRHSMIAIEQGLKSEKYPLFDLLNKAQEIKSLVPAHLFWYCHLAMPIQHFSLFNYSKIHPASSDVDSIGIISDDWYEGHNPEGGYMGENIESLFDILRTHREKAKDYMEQLAINPVDVTLKQYLRRELHQIVVRKNQLREMDYVVNDEWMDFLPEDSDSNNLNNLEDHRQLDIHKFENTVEKKTQKTNKGFYTSKKKAKPQKDLKISSKTSGENTVVLKVGNVSPDDIKKELKLVLDVLEMGSVDSIDIYNCLMSKLELMYSSINASIRQSVPREVEIIFTDINRSISLAMRMINLKDYPSAIINIRNSLTSFRRLK
jgi:hypothetical protein